MVTKLENTNLSSVLFSKSRRAVLSLLYGHADESYYLRQIVRETGLGLGPVQREIKQLADAGLVERDNKGHQVYYKANQKSPVFQELKSLITKTAGVTEILRNALAPIKKSIKVALVYGSVARGEENQRSDIDLLVVGDVTFSKIIKTLRSAHDILGREVNPTVYSEIEFRTKINEQHYFLNNVLSGKTVFVIGDKNELNRLAGERLAGKAQS